MDRLLIAGIDPGTTTAYALLDLDGKLIAISSDKNSRLSELILAMQHLGKIIIVASDVRPLPGLLSKVARQLGADTIEPDHDLNYLEKIKIVDSFLKHLPERILIKNKHEKDALAAALYGLKRTRPLLKKIDDHLKEHGVTYLRDMVRAKVLVEKLPITSAVKEASIN